MISRDYLVKICDISQERLESDIIVFGVRLHPLAEHTAVNRGAVGASPLGELKKACEHQCLQAVICGAVGASPACRVLSEDVGK